MYRDNGGWTLLTLLTDGPTGHKALSRVTFMCTLLFIHSVPFLEIILKTSVCFNSSMHQDDFGVFTTMIAR